MLRESDPMTLDRLAKLGAVRQLVGPKPSDRWRSADPLVRRSDGISIAAWFEQNEAQRRIQLVRTATTEALPWRPLLRVLVAKRPGGQEFRPIDMPTVIDQARLYLVNQWLTAYAERVLNRMAVGFRQGLRMAEIIVGANQRAQHLRWASVIDIAKFFDSVEWNLADSVIESLPAEARLKRLLRALVRVEVRDRATGERVERSMGIPQGLSVSPTLANLVLRDFDRTVMGLLSKLGVWVRRYADDIILLCPSEKALANGAAIIRDRLGRLGLSVKAGTGQILCLDAEPVTWLGVSFDGERIDVPASVIDKKTATLQDKFDRGVLTAQGIEDSLIGLTRYYQRIIDSARVEEIISIIGGGLNLTNPPRTKEGIDRLRMLITER